MRSAVLATLAVAVAANDVRLPGTSHVDSLSRAVRRHAARAPACVWAAALRRASRTRVANAWLAAAVLAGVQWQDPLRSAPPHPTSQVAQWNAWKATHGKNYNGVEVRSSGCGRPGCLTLNHPAPPARTRPSAWRPSSPTPSTWRSTTPSTPTTRRVAALGGALAPPGSTSPPLRAARPQVSLNKFADLTNAEFKAIYTGANCAARRRAPDPCRHLTPHTRLEQAAPGAQPQHPLPLLQRGRGAHRRLARHRRDPGQGPGPVRCAHIRPREPSPAHLPPQAPAGRSPPPAPSRAPGTWPPATWSPCPSRSWWTATLALMPAATAA